MKNTRVGLTGWLTPDGNFIECEYGNHSEIAKEIMRVEEDLRIRRILKGIKFDDKALKEFLFVPMGSKGEGFEGCSYIFIPTEGRFTDFQMIWLKENYSNLDEIQQSLLDKWGKIAGWRGVTHAS
jgi:hypothetical protein